MSELIIIGNGFDLHHGLNTSYGSFASFAQQRASDVHKLLSDLFLASCEYMGFERPNADAEDDFVFDRWCDFEICMGVLDDEEFGRRSLEGISEYMEELGMEEYLVDEFIDNIASILEVFRSWVAEIGLPTANRRSFSFGSTSTFLNFNYTETLETFYGVTSSRIFYIHGKRGTGDQLVVGHDCDPPQAQHKDDLPDIQHNPFYAYLRRTRKPVSEIMPRLDRWLRSAPGVTRVSVRGHSLGLVDRPYFELIAATYPMAAWSFSYHREEGLVEIQSTLRALGIPPERIVSVAKLTELEMNPNTQHNALSAQLSLQDLLNEKGSK